MEWLQGSLGHHLCLKISCLLSAPLVKVEDVLVSEEMASHAEQGGGSEGEQPEGRKGELKAEAPPSQLSNGKTM